METYEENVMKVVSYLSIGGMFEVRTGLKYDLFNKINSHSFDWRMYKQQIGRNNHELLELKLNISDAVLKGSGDSVEKMPEVISKYQLQFNQSKLHMDAYTQCKSNSICSKVVNEDDAKILNYFMTKQYAELANTPMNVEKWEAANDAIDELVEISKNKSSIDWFWFVDQYYEKEIVTLKHTLITEVKAKSQKLIDKVNARIKADKEAAAAKAAAIVAAEEAYKAKQ